MRSRRYGVFTAPTRAPRTVGPMRILHLTDTHLYGDPAARHYGRIDSHAALRGVLDRLADLDRIDLIVHAGDASEDGTAESYERLHALLDPFAEQLDAQLAVVMGNHDVSTVYAEAIAPGERVPGRQDRVLDVPGGGRVVVLDSSVPGHGYGDLDAEQLDWLRGVLADPAPVGPDGDAPGTVLVVHHPPVPAATAMLRSLELGAPEALAAVIDGSDVRVILSGHYHHEMHGELAGVPVHVAPGVTNVVDPLTAGEHERALALSGASILEIAEDAEDADGGASVRAWTSIWPNAGDDLHDAAAPVYDFGPDEIAAIIRSAGR